jgi:acyl carrier protein
MRRTGKAAVEGPRVANTSDLSLQRLRTVLAHLVPVSLLRASWRRPETAVEPRVRRLVSETLGLDAGDLTRETSLTDDLAADSLDFAEVVIPMEEEFGITLAESAVFGVRTYGELVSLVQLAVRQLRARQANAESERPPPLIWARVTPPAWHATGSFERAGWLTPYTVETIVESALRAGPGTRLEMGVPGNLGEGVMTRIRKELAWLDRRQIAVEVHRDPQLPLIGVAA